jgi:hypothetical protein
MKWLVKGLINVENNHCINLRVGVAWTGQNSDIFPSPTGPAVSVLCPSYSIIYLNLSAFLLLIALMMETVNSSETSVIIYQITRFSNSKDRHFHARRRENL